MCVEDLCLFSGSENICSRIIFLWVSFVCSLMVPAFSRGWTLNSFSCEDSLSRDGVKLYELTSLYHFYKSCLQWWCSRCWRSWNNPFPKEGRERRKDGSRLACSSQDPHQICEPAKTQRSSSSVVKQEDTASNDIVVFACLNKREGQRLVLLSIAYIAQRQALMPSARDLAVDQLGFIFSRFSPIRTLNNQLLSKGRSSNSFVSYEGLAVLSHTFNLNGKATTIPVTSISEESNDALSPGLSANCPSVIKASDNLFSSSGIGLEI